MVKKITALLLIGTLGLGLSACGVKGALYFPQQEQQKNTD